MKKLALAVVSLWLAFAAPAFATNVNIDGLPAATSVVGTDLYECEQSGTNNKCTPTLLAAYLYGLASGDCTISGTGAVVCTKTNGTAFSAFATTVPGTGVAAALGVSVGSAGAFVTFNGAGGTPSSITLTNGTSLPISTGVSGLGTGCATFLGTPSSANLRGCLTDEVGTGAAYFVGGALGTPASGTLTNATGLPIAGTTGWGTNVAAALANALNGSGGLVGYSGALGTPSSGTLTNATGLPIAGTTGWGTGVAAALANSVNAASGFATYALGSSSAFGLVKVDGTTITASGGVISSTGGVTFANPSGTAGPTANNGVATTAMRSDATPAVQKASSSQFGIVETDGQTIGNTGGVISVTVTCGLSSGASGVGANVTQRNNTATTDTVASTDCGNVLTENNASPVAVTLPVATTSGFGTGFYNTLKNKGAGLVTLTPTTSTIDGKSSITLKQYQSVDYYSDGTNYWTLPGDPTNVACGDLTNAGALCSTAPGTGVATAAAANLSAAGGITSTIASGTAALGTSAIASAACATVVTASATNTLTTDVLTASFNGDPTAVTGYVPLATGMLTIIAYPTANTANFKVCNNTSASITPGAITLNWRVVR